MNPGKQGDGERYAVFGIAVFVLSLCPAAKGADSDDPVRPPLIPRKVTEVDPIEGRLEITPHPRAIANTHPPGEVDRPEMVPFIVGDPKALSGIVLDETEAVLEGEWQYSTHTPPYVGIGYLHDRKSDKGKKSVTWNPRIPESGRYEVRLSHCYNIRRATTTPVLVRHADGETKVRINQQETPEHGKLFRSLGVFRFEKGKGARIRIETDGTEGKYVIADAIQLLKTDPAEK